MIKKILCFLGFHHYEYYGVDYRTIPYFYVIKCTRCEKKKYLFKKPKHLKKAKDFITIDSELTKLLKEISNGK